MLSSVSRVKWTDKGCRRTGGSALAGHVEINEDTLASGKRSVSLWNVHEDRELTHGVVFHDERLERGLEVGGVGGGDEGGV